MLGFVPDYLDCLVANADCVSPQSLSVRGHYRGNQLPGTSSLVKDQLECLDRAIDDWHGLIVYNLGLNDLPGVTRLRLDHLPAVFCD